MNLFKILQKNSKLYPKKVAIHINQKNYTYKKLYELTKLCIKNLYKKKLKDKTLLLIEDNSIQHICSIFASAYLNNRIIPFGKYFSLKQIIGINKVLKIDAILADEKKCVLIKKSKLKIKNYVITNPSSYKKKSNLFTKNLKNKFPKVNSNTKQDFIITFSSGSTSYPKPIVFSQSTKFERYRLFKNLYKVKRNDVIIVTCPFDHSLGMRMYLLPILTGCTCVIMDTFEKKKYCSLIDKHKITFSTLVSNQLYEILKDKKCFSYLNKLRVLISASAKLHGDDKKRILKNKINLNEMYGTTEIGTVTNLNLHKESKYFDSVGKSYDKKIDIKILNKDKFSDSNKIGEIICKTPAIFKKYINIDNKKNFFKGYFKTGDLGYLNKKNYLYFVSRKKNIIRRNGITIYPEDIEKSICNNKKIIECAVISKNLKYSEEIYLFVRVKNNLNINYVKSICLKELTPYQLPNKIKIIKKFPKTNLGKIQKFKLKEMCN